MAKPFPKVVDELLNRLGTFFGGENSFDEGVKSPFGFWCAAFQLFVQDRACQAKQDGVHGAQVRTCDGKELRLPFTRRGKLDSDSFPPEVFPIIHDLRGVLDGAIVLLDS